MANVCVHKGPGILGISWDCLCPGFICNPFPLCVFKLEFRRRSLGGGQWWGCPEPLVLASRAPSPPAHHPPPHSGSSSSCAQRRRLVCEADPEARQEAGREPCCQHPGGRTGKPARDKRPALHECLGAPHILPTLPRTARPGPGALWGSTLTSENTDGGPARTTNALGTRRTHGEAAAAAPQTSPTMRHPLHPEGPSEPFEGLGGQRGYCQQGLWEGALLTAVQEPISRKRNIPSPPQGGDPGPTWGAGGGLGLLTDISQGSSTIPPPAKGRAALAGVGGLPE